MDIKVRDSNGALLAEGDSVTLVKDDVPAEFTYIDCDSTEHTDSRPTGLIVRYKGEFGEIKVVFLILDLGQHIQRNASPPPTTLTPATRRPGPPTDRKISRLAT
jgi:hypothetical protein